MTIHHIRWGAPTPHNHGDNINDCWTCYGLDPIWNCDFYVCDECGVNVPEYVVVGKAEPPDTHRPSCSYSRKDQ